MIVFAFCTTSQPAIMDRVQLKVNVCEAVDLLEGGSVDAQADISVDGFRSFGTTRTDHSLNPVWGQFFTFGQ